MSLDRHKNKYKIRHNMRIRGKAKQGRIVGEITPPKIHKPFRHAIKNAARKVYRLPLSYKLAAGSAAAFLVVAVVALLPKEASVPTQDLTASSGAKNVLLIVTDDQNFESLKSMPYLAKQSTWFKFNNAFVNTPLCCPARSTILTGQTSEHTKVTTNPNSVLFDDKNTIATAAQQRGYRTGLFGKYFNYYPWNKGAAYVPPGWTKWLAFNTNIGYYNYTLNDNGQMKNFGAKPADYSTDVLADRTIQFINQSKREKKPFLAYYAPYGPHAPMTPAERHKTKERQYNASVKPANFNEFDVSDKPAWVRALTPKATIPINKKIKGQYGSLLSVDENIEKMVNQLRRNGQLDNTVIIFLSDNGYSMGSHRFEGKPCPYEECVRLPMMIRYPGVNGTATDAMVSNMDIAPTIADVTGARLAKQPDGNSLLPLLQGRYFNPNRSIYMFSSPVGGKQAMPYFWGLRTSQYKYIEYSTGEKELYDLRVDGQEMTNRANDPNFAQEMYLMSQALKQQRAQQQ